VRDFYLNKKNYPESLFFRDFFSTFAGENLKKSNINQ